MNIKILVFLFCSGFIFGNYENHNKPFGSGHTVEVGYHDGFIDPVDFIENFFLKNEPILFKQAANKWPAILLWSDDYFLNLNLSGYNKTTVHVEVQKKENRSQRTLNMEFKEFISLYNTSDIYFVDKLPPFLDKDISIPWSLQCSLWENSINQVLMWFSSGGTSSVVHTDDMENINCLLSGEKTFVLVNPHLHKSKIPLNNNGAYSDIDVDQVDFNKYPGMDSVEFQIANMTAGDCLYIPRLWIHQVRSFHRNIAINIWFTKTKDELDGVTRSELERDCSPLPIDRNFMGTTFLGFGSTHSSYLDFMKKFDNIRAEGLLKTILQAYPDIRSDSIVNNHISSVINDIFVELDRNNDSLIEIDEINASTNENFIRVANYLKYLKVYLESLMVSVNVRVSTSDNLDPSLFDIHSEL